MVENDDKYLVLRGKNNDIYFIQKRVSKKVSEIIGKDFIKKSLETSNIIEARAKRDKILAELASLEAMSTSSSNQNNSITEDKLMQDKHFNVQNPMREDNMVNKSDNNESFLDEYLDMDYIRSLRLPSKDELIDKFDNNLLILLILGVMAVTFLLN
tara:strand:- start:14761 stop:15228 length:468 start_codon:yes stop_codon:yes gene_type:complete